MVQLKRVALLMSKNIGYNRDVIEGVYAYSQKRQDWIFHDSSPSVDAVQWIRDWKPDGVIGHLYDKDVAEAIRKLDIPVINTTDSLSMVNFPLVDVNHYEVSKLAGEYLLGLGFEHFGYLGSAKLQYSKQRYSGFNETIGKKADACFVEYLPRIPELKELKMVLGKIRGWVTSLPKPVAIFCSNDVPARDLADICIEAGIKVPDEVVILGVDNDLVECRLSRPPLSSIEIPAARIGYAAAEMLGKLMDGAKPSELAILSPSPIRVVERESTTMNAAGDVVLQQAMKFIHSSYASITGVDDVVSQVGVGRRALEMRFKEVLQMSILDAILARRINVARKLFLSPSSSVAEVSDVCGFSSTRRFSQVFKQKVGVSPMAYKKMQKVE